MAGRAVVRRPRRSRRSGPRNKGNWWSVALVVFGIVVAISWFIEDEGPTPAAATCALPGSAVTITPEQAANAAIIAEVAWDRGLPDRAVVIALATAQQESGLRNIDYGDRDSLGLFQQRPSMGWGTEAQVQDPEYAAGKFFDRLVGVVGWETARLTDVSSDAFSARLPGGVPEARGDGDRPHGRPAGQRRRARLRLKSRGGSAVTAGSAQRTLTSSASPDGGVRPRFRPIGAAESQKST